MSNTKFVLRTVVLALGGSVLVFFLVGLALADQWLVTTTRTIPAPATQLVDKIIDLRQWPTWSAVDFQLGNPTKREFQGEAGKADQSATWRGPKGIATVLLTRIDENDVDYAIGFKFGPEGETFGGKFTGTISWRQEGDETVVTWSEHGQLINLLQRWSNWFGALQVKVAQVQRASLAGLEEHVRRSAGKAQLPKDDAAAVKQK